MSSSHKMNSTVVEVGDTQRSQEEQFKQRLIWAMLAMKSQDVSEDIMWKNLNREFFRDCKNLVKCMQQSVQSKLKSMLQVNDVREHLSKENQMSAVDWLLFDTIMVDEGIDVLHFEDLEAKCLEDLFELVKEYKVEGLEGETLAKAWIRITLQYNKGGRECSPMLLQLRWYQLKKFARCRIYRKPYPGQNHHQKLLTAIAITYQKIITIPFAEWKTFVKKRLVILPKEFLKIIKQEPELKHVDPCEIWYLPKEKKIQLITENTIEKTRRGNVPFIITNVMSKAAESNKGRNLTHVATAVNCANDTEIIICDSDDEFNDLLRDKANNLTELSLKTSECIPKNTSKQKKRVFNKININKFSSNSIPSVPKVSDELITLDSDDEMDKILQEKANLIRKNSFSNIKDKITIEKETAKEKNHYEGGEEEDFENENIEFVDDGIEFIEDVNKNQKNGSKIASVSCRNTSETDESSEFDLKLLMNVTVYTKKLNHMEVFKFIDFNEVKDKRVIDRATLESKPRDKHAPKTEDIERLREEAIPSKETKGTQERSDMRSKHIINKVKCTSWLFQKPRKRTYDMTQLSKNPDFNHRLQPKKNLSLRSLELVKECFPITVDLHREFENKLVDGTVYLDSGKFKSAKTVAGAGELENKCNNLRIPSISVRKPSELLQAYVRKATLTDFIPIPDTINKIPNTMKLIPDTINQIPDSDENDVCKISNSSFVQLTKIESHPRRKVINLPHIAEIRATNQSLHVAEIPPTHQNEQIISNLREENRGMAKKIHVNASNVANTKKLDYLAVSIDNVAMRKANNTTPKISPAVPSNSANTSGPLRKDSNKSFVNSMIKRIQPRKNSVQTNVITVQSKPKQLITKSSVNIEKPLVVPECAKSSLKVQNSSNITLKQNTKNISQSSNISEDTKFILLPDGIKFVQLPGNELAVSIEPTASIQPKDFSVIMDICASSNAANKPKIITQQHPNNIIPKLVPFNTNEQQQSVLKKCIVKRRLPTKNIKCIKPSVERDRGKVQIVLNATKPYDTKVQDIIGVTGDMGKRVTTEVRPVVNKIGISADTCINREFSVSSSSVAAGASGITSDMSIATASLAQNIYLVPSASNTDGLSNVTGVLTPVTVTNGFRINVESVNPELCPLTNVPTYNTLGSSEVIGLSNITNKVGNKNIANPKSYTLQSGMEINTRTDSVYQEMWNVVIEGEKESNTDLKILGS